MALINWWMPATAAAVLVWILLVAVIVAVVRRGRKRRAEASVPIAHGDRLTALPGYRRALLRYRTLLVSAVVLVSIALVASIAVASRPATASLTSPELASRDIVLCLDISGSMVEYDSALVEVFGELSQEFTGERISLVLFNASAATYFPLTNDYDYIADQLGRLQEAFDTEDESIFSGTLQGDGSSIIGDGLASCALRFDTPEADRSRSIILATDNLLAGRAIYTLPQAAELAASKGIRVYGINPGDTEARGYLESLATEFELVVQATGGAYYGLDDPNAVESIVGRITAEQAAVLPGDAQIVLADRPHLPFLLLLLALGGYLLVIGRLKR